MRWCLLLLKFNLILPSISGLSLNSYIKTVFDDFDLSIKVSVPTYKRPTWEGLMLLFLSNLETTKLLYLFTCKAQWIDILKGVSEGKLQLTKTVSIFSSWDLIEFLFYHKKNYQIMLDPHRF